MSIVFDKNEIFKIAIQIERNGADFYSAAAEKAEKQDARQLLLELSKAEEEHEKIFVEMEMEGVGEELDFDPYHEAVEYLRAVADNNVFKINENIDGEITGKEAVEDVIERAIRHEKDSIIFYAGMKEILKDKSDKEKIDRVIREEMRHIVQLKKKQGAC